MNIFQHFHTAVPKVNEANLISIDFGDGMLSASIVMRNPAENTIDLQPLYFDAGKTLQQNVAAFYMEEDNPENDILKLNQEANGSVFYNYKRCPGTPESRMHYTFDSAVNLVRNGETIRTQKSTLTYEDVMVRAFNALVNHLFKFNNVLDKAKPTYIFVGRPSGTVWKEHERYYADILSRKLSIQGYDRLVHILVLPESTAALAIHTQGDDAIEDDQYVLVLDLGSSTFDATLITPIGIPVGGEDSRQFGANLLDEVLVRMLLSQMKEGWQPKDPHGLKLYVRTKKEQYYGPGGNANDRTTVYCEIEKDGCEDEIELRLSKKTLNDAMQDEKWPVKYCTYMPHESGALIPQWRSQPWLAACREIFLDFRKHMSAHLPEGKKGFDRVILTGGVAIMPEMLALAQEIFGQVVTTSGDRCFAVSKGLAYMLYVEARKQELLAGFLPEDKNAPSKVATLLLDNASSLQRKILANLSEQIYNMALKAMQDWRDNEPADQRKPKEVIDAAWAAQSEGILAKCAGYALPDWQGEMNPKLENKIKESVRELFPHAAQHMDQVHLDDCAKKIEGLKLNVSIKLGLGDLFGMLLRRLWDGTSARVVRCEKMEAQKDKLKEKLWNSLEYQLTTTFVKENLIAPMIPPYKKAVETFVNDKLTPYLMMTVAAAETNGGAKQG